ncbi:MAG TPA: hypothetical protein VGE72_19710, partial [Azospirillum sp.]
AGPVAEARGFARTVADYRALAHDTLDRCRAAGWSVVLYGAGHRACVTVTGLDLAGRIDRVIDDRPTMAGGYLPGTGLAIQGGDTLAGHAGPMLVLLAVSNENEVKVKRRLRAMNLDAVFATILSPRDTHDELAAVRAALLVAMAERTGALLASGHWR